MDKLKLDISKIEYAEGGIREETVRVPFEHSVLAAIPSYYKYENIVYAADPVDPERQKMNIFIHPAYLEGKSVNGYTAETAPVLFHIEGGGFRWQHVININENSRVYMALQKGFTVVCPSFRGPNDHYIDTDGDGEPEYTGVSPAGLVDIKAAIRFLRHNSDSIPGDFSKILIAGCSSGGAMSALAGASGNTHRLDKYLREIGAADEPDDVFAAADYFGPTALGICDDAYDWIFGRGTYEQTVLEKEMPVGPPRKIYAALERNGLPVMLTGEKAAYDCYNVYAKHFVDSYISGRLGMTEREYTERLLSRILPAYHIFREENPAGRENDYFYFDTYKDYLDRGFPADPLYDEKTYPACGGYINFDLFRAYNSKNACKSSPSFDLLKPDEMYGSENALFGSAKCGIANFTEYGAANSEAGEKVLTDDIKERVRNQDPFSYIETGDSDCAEHWYIMHGTADGDIPITLSADLAQLLEEKGKDVDLSIIINNGHEGDDTFRELENLFRWFERIIRKHR